MLAFNIVPVIYHLSYIGYRLLLVALDAHMFSQDGYVRGTRAQAPRSVPVIRLVGPGPLVWGHIHYG